MKLHFICQYCNNDFKTFVYDQHDVENIQCPKCGDRNLDQIRYDSIDTYGKEVMKDAYVKKSN